MSGGNLIVTLELPNGAGIDLQSPSAQPSTVIRAVALLDTNNSEVLPTLPTEQSGTAGIIVHNDQLIWQLPYNGPGVNQLQQLVVGFLDEAISGGIAVQWFARFRFRLVGRMIWAGSFPGPLYLDGQVFGLPGTRADGSTPRLDLQLPSGNDDTASDFEGWFYVAPTLQVTGVTVSNAALRVVLTGDTVTSVVDAQSGETVAPFATVTLNYAALPVTVAAEGTVTLSLGSSATGATIATIPLNVALIEGESTLNVNISVVGNPGALPTGAPVTDTFTITATLGAAVPPSSSQQATFTVTGVLPPPPPPGRGPILGGINPIQFG